MYMNDDDDLIVARIGSILDDIEHRESLPFNGLMGAMPSWLPEPFKNEFRRTRDTLLNNYSENQIIKWIKEYKMMVDAPYGVSTPNISYEISLQNQIERLFILSHAVELGEIEGLRYIAGGLAVMGSSYSKEQSKRAKEPRKLTSSQIQSINAAYAQGIKEGSVYGLLKLLAREYNVTSKAISNVVKKHNLK